MKPSEITPAWIRIRAQVRGMRIADLATAIGMERTKLSKSLHGKRNFLGWELMKLAEVLGEAPPYAMQDPDITGLVEDYLALSEPDRLRARAVLRALLQAEAHEETPRAPAEPKG